jgi:Glycosyl transferases group 1
MHIFLSCQQALRKHNIPAYSFWETYFKKGIEEAGHDWIEAEDVDWAEGLVYSKVDEFSKWRDRIWNRTVDYIKHQHKKQPIDLFLSYLFPKQVEPAAIKEIQSLGIPCVNFFCDNVREFTQVPRDFFCFDLHWVPEFKALKFYQQASLKHIYAPMPVWIPPEQRTCEHPENYGTSFIGSRDIQREILLAQILEAGIAIEIRGAGWDWENTPQTDPLTRLTIWQTSLNQWNFIRQQGIVPWTRKTLAKSQPRVSSQSFEKFVKPQPDAGTYIEILQQSQITLGINRYPSFHYPFLQPNTYSRMRDIEAPMMGACYLTEWTEGLDHLYELGKEIETYCTAAEMVEKIQRLIASPKKRRELRHQGQKRALADHTITRSISKIGVALGVNG